MADVTIRADQKVKLTAQGRDGRGNIVAPATPVVWDSSDPAVIQMQAAGVDSKEQFARAVGPVGTATVTATDANNIVKSVTVEVTPGAAVELVIVIGAITLG